MHLVYSCPHYICIQSTAAAEYISTRIPATSIIAFGVVVFAKWDYTLGASRWREQIAKCIDNNNRRATPMIQSNRYTDSKEAYTAIDRDRSFEFFIGGKRST